MRSRPQVNCRNGNFVHIISPATISLLAVNISRSSCARSNGRKISSPRLANGPQIGWQSRQKARLENWLAISRKSLPLFLRIQFSLHYASFRSTFGPFVVRGGYWRANAIIISHCSVLIKTEISSYTCECRPPTDTTCTEHLHSTSNKHKHAGIFEMNFH